MRAGSDGSWPARCVNGYRGLVTEWGSPGQTRARVLRAAVLAIAAVALALGAHLVSGGSRPPIAALAAGVLTMTLVMGLLVGRRRSSTGLLLGLGGAQLLLHQWFALATPGECARSLAGQLLPGMHVAPAGLAWGALARACAGTGQAGATMLMVAVATHTLAALITGALIVRGDALLACAAALVLPDLPSAAPVRTAPRPAVVWAPRTSSGAPAGRYVDRRGPPAVAACAA